MNHEQIAKNLSDGIDAALFEQYGAEWKRRAEQAERDRDTLATEVRAWRDADTSHKLRAVQAEHDRAVLAAALRAWIKHYEDGLFGDEEWTRLKRLTNAARLAMARAKAMEEQQ